jgi:uncharacterized membrane protein YdfJ with MMPL/SSD domain
MPAAWGRFIHRHRWAVLALSLVSSVVSLWLVRHAGAPSNLLVPQETESGRAPELMHRELRARPRRSTSSSRIRPCPPPIPTSAPR